MNKQELQDGVFTFEFEPQEAISWQAGQYLHYTLHHPNPDDRGEDRYFTISSPPYEKTVKLTTRWSGDKASTFKKALFALEPGAEIEADPPDGRFTWREDASKHVLVSGGIGVTPFHSMLLQMDNDGKKIEADLLYANRDDNYVFDGELAQIATKHPGLRIKKFTGKEITIKDLKPYAQVPGAVFYLSGPKSMVVDFTNQLIAAGVSDDNILKDRFPGYDSVAHA